MMTATDLSHAFFQLAMGCRVDSERWFPDLHDQHGLELAVHYALGLGGETGELLNLIKKANRGDELDREKVADEVADVFIYLVDLAYELGINVYDAFEVKHAKLVERWGAG